MQLFFVASALTLWLSMSARYATEQHAKRNFYIRRFFRIAPCFYLAIVFYSIYHGLNGGYWAPNGIQWWFFPLTFLFMHGLHPETINSVVPGGWSIAVEAMFYVIAPFVFSRVRTIKSALLCLILTYGMARLSSKIIKYFFISMYPEQQQYMVHNFAYLSFLSQLPIFFLVF